MESFLYYYGITLPPTKAFPSRSFLGPREDILEVFLREGVIYVKGSGLHSSQADYFLLQFQHFFLQPLVF